MFTANSRIGAVAAVIGLMALGTGAAQASAAELVGPDVVVSFGDLDLSTKLGAETLYGRIQVAAGKVCRQLDSSELAIQAAATRCQNELVARTVDGLRSPQLAAIYESHRNDHRPV